MDRLQLLARSLHALTGDRMARLARWRGLLIFNYHRIGDATRELQGDRALYSATQDAFADQMAFLARHFDVIQPADLERVAQNGNGRHVMVTFDDGYRDNYELAFPVLRAQGFGATFFVATRFLDEGVLSWWDEIAWIVRQSTRPCLPRGPWTDAELSLSDAHRANTLNHMLACYKRLEAPRCPEFLDWLADASGSGRCPPEEMRRMWMTWDMVREMRAGGMTIGGHSVSHPVLSRLTAEQQLQEVRDCARRLNDELAEPMRWFAYPVGGRDAFNADTRAALAELGVEYAFSYYGNYNAPGQWDRFDLKRVSVEHEHDRARFRATSCLPSLFGQPDAPLTQRLRATARELMA